MKYLKILCVDSSLPEIEKLNQDLEDLGFVRLLSHTWMYENGNKTITELYKNLSCLIIEDSYVICNVSAKGTPLTNMVYAHNCEHEPLNQITTEMLTKYHDFHV